MSTKSYNELSKLSSFKDRYDYARLHGSVGTETFGYDRYLNQSFYRSAEWKKVRNQVILRDDGCDLGTPGVKIHGKIIIHHLNPLTLEDVENCSEKMLDPNNLVCVSQSTHNAIHYGDDEIVRSKELVERKPNDTCPWK